jgi:hypothetical protein
VRLAVWTVCWNRGALHATSPAARRRIFWLARQFAMLRAALGAELTHGREVRVFPVFGNPDTILERELVNALPLDSCGCNDEMICYSDLETTPRDGGGTKDRWEIVPIVPTAS